MPFCTDIATELRSDIENRLPRVSSGEPCTMVLQLTIPQAPIVAISRDSRGGKIEVPHLFFACQDIKHLARIADITTSHPSSLMLLCHTIEGARMGKFLVLPFLFNRPGNSAQFIETATTVGDIILQQSDFNGAYIISDCALKIYEGGRVLQTVDYPGSINHLRD